MSSMSFSPHINNIIVAKASEMLRFIRRNLSKCSKELKSILLTLVWSPNFRIYSSPVHVWDPYIATCLLTDIQSIEKAQRCSYRPVVVI